ncbi:CPBP family glutamic-type intramembrane protease [Corynebacterium sp. 335C]
MTNRTPAGAGDTAGHDTGIAASATGPATDAPATGPAGDAVHPLRRAIPEIAVAIAVHALISAIGFGLLARNGIGYTDAPILWWGIPHMIVTALWVWVIQRRHFSGHRLWPDGFREATARRVALWPVHTWALRVLLISVVVSIAATFVESGVRGLFHPMIISALILSLLIGFSEEGLYRKFILDRAGDGTTSKVLFLLASALLFGFVRMVNVTTGMAAADALNQSLSAVVVGLFYLETRSLFVLALWHANVDFQLFATHLGDATGDTLYAAPVIGIVVDGAAIVLLVACLASMAQRALGQRRARKTAQARTAAPAGGLRHLSGADPHAAAH